MPAQDSRLPELPQEIFDEITTYLPDRKSRAVWGLVCKRFLPSSRQTLYKAITLRNMQDVERFFDLLKSPLCTFNIYVREFSAFEGSGVRWVHLIIPRLASFSLERLQMDFWNWGRLGTKALKNLSPVCENLTHLELSSTNFASFSQLADLLYSCTSLKHLEVFGCFWKDHSTPTPSAAKLLPSLETLYLRGSWQKEIMLDWLFLHGRHPANISSLILTDIVPNDTVILGQCLRVLGPSLKILRLRFGGYGGTEGLFLSLLGEWCLTHASIKNFLSEMSILG